ncbi:MAG: VapE domain-containing protein [Cyanobacterium sp.]
MIYLADNDEAGITQAIRFYKAWQEFDSEDLDILLLPTRALFKLVGRSPEPKDDFADLVPFLTEDFKELLESLIQIEGDNYTTELLALDHQYEGLLEEKKEIKKSSPELIRFKSVSDFYYALKDIYGNRLKYNEMLRIVELDGEPADLENFYIHLSLNEGFKVTKQLAYDVAVELAKNNNYHPVIDYLDLVQPKLSVDIKKLSTLFFGTNNSLFDEMIYRTLIGSVARLYEPGCKMDTALILHGKQGAYKSTFFKVLYGADFFSDSVAGTDKDDLLVLHQRWCCELAEIEKITTKKKAGELKAFLSRAEDSFREPYGRIIKTYKRKNVIVGTVNETEFLVDPTGNRRFWVVPAFQKIDLKLVAELRDSIWYHAKNAYFAGERWYLSDERQEESEKLNQTYIYHDSWDNEALDNYLTGFEEIGITVREILTNHFDFLIEQVGKPQEMRITKILSQKGWRKVQKRHDGKNRKCWIKDN